MIPQLLLIALGTLLSEDLTCIATGALVAQHQIGLLEGTLACLTGIFGGDMLLFLAGRAAGSARVLHRWIPHEKLEQASAWLDHRGLVVVLLSRFAPGLRLPTYVAAGLLRSRLWAFTGYFFLASALWTPLLVGGTAAFGEQALHRTLGQGSPVAAALVVAVALWTLRRRGSELYAYYRRVIGFWKRKVQWEFWPAWAAYLPLAPYFLFLAWRHRSLTLFTLANPGIHTGGLTGESKSEILRHLQRVSGVVPEFTLIPAELDSVGRMRRARAFLVDHGLKFPVVLKPDRGERGSGVMVARSAEDLEAYFEAAESDTIIQRYVAGAEFGVYYARDPREAQGQVLSITGKRFPAVRGDGRSTLRDLIFRDSRAVCLATAYLHAAKRPILSVPAAGEDVPLVEIGSHCRGAIFLDATSLRTPELERAIDRISQAHPGFFLGRYDVRAESAEALRQGRFRVIELNGVAAEATHVYDPRVSLREAYRVMFVHWRTAFEIGAAHRDQGLVPIPWLTLLRKLRRVDSSRRLYAAPEAS